MVFRNNTPYFATTFPKVTPLDFVTQSGEIVHIRTSSVNEHQTLPFRLATAFCYFAIQCKLVYPAYPGLKCRRISHFLGIYPVKLKVYLCIISYLMDRPNHLIYHLISFSCCICHSSSSLLTEHGVFNL